MTSLFVYILRGKSPFFSSVSCHLPFGNHAKTDIFPHNILITFAADVQPSVLHTALQAIRSLSCYERLRSKGKPGKVALIAAANKLIRQAFAVITQDKPYIDGYVSSKK